MPTPDTVDNGNGPTCAPSDCTESALCYACYAIFDGIWKRATARRTYIQFCDEVGSDLQGATSGTCTSGSTGYVPTDVPGLFDCSLSNPIPCWGVKGLTCPDCTEPEDPFATCYAEYSVKCPQVNFTVECAEGCCTLTVTITYVVQKACDEDFINGLPETTYTHTFERTNICSCEDTLGALTFVSTTSENNARGITVPDVCNAASATLTAVGEENCGCICFDCFDFSNEINVSLAGTVFTGTAILTYVPFVADPIWDRGECRFAGFITTEDCIIEVRVIITCLPCDKYDITVEFRNGGGIDECVVTYEKLGTDCSGLSGFTFVSETGTCACGDLTDFTISLS